MANDVINVPVAAPPSDQPKASGKIAGKARPAVAGVAVYGLSQAIGFLAGKFGFKIDQPVLQSISIIAAGSTAGATWILSAATCSPSLVFSFRVVNLRGLLLCRFIDKDMYLDLMKSAELAYKKSIKG